MCGGDFGAKIELKVAKQINDHFAFSNMELVKGQRALAQMVSPLHVRTMKG